MVRIQKGLTYTAKMVRSGVSSRGDWELIKVSDERGRRDITIWPENKPSGVQDGGQFVVEEITEVSYGARKRNDKWVEDVGVSAIVRPTSTPKDFGYTIDDVGENPFDSDPFAKGGVFELPEDGQLPF
jgi:hypothetical protein